MARMPIIFLGHGSPMNLLEENTFTWNWYRLGKEMARPKAIIMISAHWFTRGLFLTEERYPETIHDFFGFPEELYRIEYKAENRPDYRDRVKSILGEEVELSSSWGYDHGNYSVLSYMYPDADIPLLQLSINGLKRSDYHYQIGKKLKELREEGFLIIASGNIVHNLSKMKTASPAYGFAQEFNEKLKGLLLDKNFEELVELEEKDRNFKACHPSPDHYYPLISLLGAVDEEDDLEIFNDSIIDGSLSMTSFIWS